MSDKSYFNKATEKMQEHMRQAMQDKLDEMAREMLTGQPRSKPRHRCIVWNFFCENCGAMAYSEEEAKRHEKHCFEIDEDMMIDGKIRDADERDNETIS